MQNLYKRFKLTILLSIVTSMLWGQDPQQTWELKTDESSTTKKYVARDQITLKADGTTNFRFSATDYGQTFSAKIDAGLLFPPTSNTYALPDGNITTNPTQGGIVGAIPGQFNVSPSGSANYTIPIEVPSGINGMQPNVALVYNSQGANGIVGWGWNISGMSSISRTGSNLYNDGKIRSPQLTTDDNLTLDGQRLILVSDAGTNLTDGAKYRTEIETYSDITYKSINGYVCFEVKTKEGITMEFGSSADSYIHAQESTVAITWLLTKITDANGNYMTYSYGNDANFEEFWLDKIKYTCNDAAGITTGANEIDFIYSTGRADSQTNYFVGKKMKQTRLLQTIKTITNSETQREYSFTYSIADGFYNKLTQIDEKGNDGTKFNPTIIDWNKLNSTTQPTFGFTTNNTAIGATFDNFTLDKTMIFVDFNNDGFVDVIRPTLQLIGNSYAYTGWEMYKSINGLSFGTTPFQKEVFDYQPISPCYLPAQYQLMPADINGDGKPDIVEVRNYTDQTTHITSCDIDVLLNINGTLVRQNLAFNITGNAYENISFELGDFNGDGNTELIAKKKYQSSETSTLCMYSIVIDTKVLSLICSTAVSGDLSKSRTTDVNGNGLPEIFVPSGSGSKFLEYNATSNSFNEISFTHSLVPSVAELEFGDFNGDGKTDVLQYLSGGTLKWTILISTGTGFESVSCPLTRTKHVQTSDTDPGDFYTIKDLNGDGKGDIIEVPKNTNTVNLYYYNGSGFDSTTHTIIDASGFFNDRTLPYYDINGDGKSDIVNTSNTSFSIISFSTPETERTVSTITNGMGIKNIIEYKLLNDTTVYTNGTGTCATPVVKLCIPIPVVSNTNTSAGALSETSNYSYKGLRLHTKGKGMLGFEEFTQDNVTQDKKSVTQFSYNTTYFNVYPTQQIVSRSTISGSQPISTTTYLNDIISLGGKRIFPYTSSQTTTDNLTGLTATTETSNFDGYGNPQTIITTKGTAAASKIVETSTGTYIQKGSWCPNKISTISSTKLVNGQTSTRTSQYTFDNNGNIATEITDPTDVNSVTTTYQNYDSFGHCRLITKTANGLSRSTSSTYASATNPSGRFLSSKTNSLGETTTYIWDETKSQLNSETNRVGTTSYTYKGFGSLIETRYPDGIRKAQVLQWASTDNTLGAKYYTYAETSGSAPSQVWYDAAGRELVKETYGLNNNKISVSTEYYADGKIHRISAPYFDQDASSKTWDNTYTYDDYGRLSTLTTPMGVSSSTYNGKTTTATTKAIDTTPIESKETTVNDAGQIITSTVNGKAVSYTYYASGLPHTSTPEGGQTITIEYNLQGKRTKLTDPDGGIVESKYNGFGELTEEKQKIHDVANYITTTKNYDVLKGYPLSTVRNGETTSYNYDTKNRVSTIEIVGKNKQTFTYDAFDRITNVKEEIGSRIYNTSKEYDALGRVKKEIYPSGIYTVNLYDSNGHLIEIKDNSNRSIWKANAENARRQLTSINKGIKETTFGFDNRGLPTSIVASGVEDMSYSFDAKGNLEYRVDDINHQQEYFEYDGLNRLVSWTPMNGKFGGETKTITYSETGNMTTKNDLGNFTLSYGGKRPDGTDIGSHALATISGVPAGFPTADLNITYTDFKKVATLSEGTKYYMLTYGVDGQRRKSEYYANGQSQGIPTLTKYYVGNYEEEVNALGNVRKIHYFSGGAMLIQNNGVDSLLYGYSDFQGSLIALTDASGNIVEKYAYDPWGARRNPTDWTQKDTRTKWITNRGYTGHEHIDEFGIINMNGRVYDPATGMFMSPDPYIQAPKDWLNYNRYSYCMGNPFKYTDPSGKFWLFRLIFGAMGLVVTPFDFVINLISGQNIRNAWNNAWNSGAVAGWNGGKSIDESIFGKPNTNQNATTGIAGSDGILYTNYNGDKYYKFNDLQSMVNYMYNTTNSDNSDNPFHYEMVGYALENAEGKTEYYLLDWSGNTNEKSSNPYTKGSVDPYDGHAMMNRFDGKAIIAEFHTHPASYYAEKNRLNGYDGPSYEDQNVANALGVPVYSIGPHSVSVIKPNGDKTEDYFKNLAGHDYKSNDSTYVDTPVSWGGSEGFKKFTLSQMKNVNPYAIGETSAWLANPQP